MEVGALGSMTRLAAILFAWALTLGCDWASRFELVYALYSLTSEEIDIVESLGIVRDLIQPR